MVGRPAHAVAREGPPPRGGVSAVVIPTHGVAVRHYPMLRARHDVILKYHAVRDVQVVSGAAPEDVVAGQASCPGVVHVHCDRGLKRGAIRIGTVVGSVASTHLVACTFGPDGRSVLGSWLDG